MQHKVLALKYRPLIFENVIGQEHITVPLINSIKSGRTHHAYLFSGPRGVGKTTTARILAKSLNCEKGPTSQPCNKCKNCIEIIKSISMDVEEIDGASNRGINEIRDLKEKTKFYPLNSKYKIFIIDEVHMLTSEAFNALLKILEEPPEYVVFIFATTEPHKIPLTILSRCQRYDFKRISLKKIVENFKTILQKENVYLPDSILYRVAKKSEGSMRDGLSLLEQIFSFYNEANSENYIEEILGYTNATFFHNLLNNIIDNKPKKIVESINLLYYNGIDFKDFSKELIDYLHNLITLYYFPENKDLIDDSVENIGEMKKIIKKGDIILFETFLTLLLKEFNYIKISEFPEINIKLLCLKVLKLNKLKNIDEIINDLKNISITSKTSNVVEEIFSWKEFLNFLSLKKPILYGFLSDSKIVSITDSKITVEINQNIPDEEKFIKEIQNTIEQFSSKKFTVELKKSKKLSFKHEVLQNKAINDILKLFNGKIEEIKYK